MRPGPGPPANDPTRAGSGRLVNLALGMSATIALVPFVFAQPSLTTILLRPWFSKSSLQTVPPWIMVGVELGVGLWFPASILMLLFALTGLTQKLGARMPRLTGVILTANWITYVTLTIVMLCLAEDFEESAVGWLAGLFLWLTLQLMIIVGFIASLQQLAALWRYKVADSLTLVSRRWIVWAVIPPVLLVSPLWFAPSQPRALTANANAEFTALCRTTGVRFMAKPAAPVRSIAYDWNPARMERPSGFPTVDERGNITGGGESWSGPYEVAKGRERLVFDFIESRQDDWCHARSDVRMPYAHCPSRRANVQLKAPYYAIDTLTADVLVYFEVDRLDFKTNRITHGPVRFQVTITDRRSGAVLGEMAYVVDRANRRACGVNFGSKISYEAFIWDAIHQ